MNTFGRITVRDCVNVPPPPDPRCSDPAFSLANPDVCPSSPHLIVKPGMALACALGSVQFSAMLVTNGTELDVSADCVWMSSDMSCAVIGATSGNATGLAQGNATISATYLAYTATSELSVMASSGSACCDSERVAMMLVVDNSRSMSQQFGTNYTTRLAYAKSAASRFAGEVNILKDLVGLITFNDSSVIPVDSLTDAKATVQTHCSAIAQTQQKTSFYDALSLAISELDRRWELWTVDQRAIVLFSDGEDTSDAAANAYVGSNNPIQLLSDFKADGGIVICLGCRASGGGFALLSAFATGGFLVNGYPDSEAAALDYLSGLKGYICAGNCTPVGDVIVGEGALNYSAFENWTVSGGNVDLIGNSFIDLLPGNGLYVDLAGSSAPHNGLMTSRTPFPLTAGHAYRVSATLAGNQVEPGTPYVATIKVYYLNGTDAIDLLSQTVVISDYTQGFTPYSFTFTAPVAVDAYISIQQQAAPSGNNPNFGLLLGQVSFDDTTTLEILLNPPDDFDGENQVYVPPRCGQASLFINGAYAVGYNCYGQGCLDAPPPAQLPDPHPLPPIESGYTPPVLYTSTMRACATCPTGTINQNSSELLITTDTMSVDLDNPAVAKSYILVGSISQSDLLAFRFVEFDISIQGSSDGVTWETIQTDYRAFFAAAEGQSENYAGHNSSFQGNAKSFSHYRITSVRTPPGIGHGLPASFETTEFSLYQLSNAAVCREATATGVSRSAADTNAYDAALLAAQSALSCVPFYSWTETVIIACPIGTFGPAVTKTITRTSYVSLDDAKLQAKTAATEQAQLEIDAGCTQSNNTQPVILPDREGNQGIAVASNWPMVQNVTGETGVIAGMTVAITGFSHTWPDDIHILLRGPDGTTVGIMRNCGGSETISNVDLEFADSGPSLPDSTIITSGTYAPTTFGVDSWVVTPPWPDGLVAPTSFLLSDFDGKSKNGQWSLWVYDKAFGNEGSISGGFLVTFL